MILPIELKQLIFSFTNNNQLVNSILKCTILHFYQINLHYNKFYIDFYLNKISTIINNKVKLDSIIFNNIVNIDQIKVLLTYLLTNFKNNHNDMGKVKHGILNELYVDLIVIYVLFTICIIKIHIMIINMG